MNWHTMFFILGDFPPKVIMKLGRILFLGPMFKTAVTWQCTKIVLFTYNRKKATYLYRPLRTY